LSGHVGTFRVHCAVGGTPTRQWPSLVSCKAAVLLADGVVRAWMHACVRVYQEVFSPSVAATHFERPLLAEFKPKVATQYAYTRCRKWSTAHSCTGRTKHTGRVLHVVDQQVLHANVVLEHLALSNVDLAHEQRIVEEIKVALSLVALLLDGALADESAVLVEGLDRCDERMNTTSHKS